MAEQEATGGAEPKATRPVMPAEYGVPKGKKGMLAWSRVDECLARATVYWLATASPSGRPHSRPVWGLWAGGAFYFGGAPNTRWYRNLAANPQLEVHIECDGLVIILEGTMELATPTPEVFRLLAAQSQAKYKMGPQAPEEGPLLRPRKVLAWDNNDFGRTATRWRFEAD